MMVEKRRAAEVDLGINSEKVDIAVKALRLEIT
jgi:hypothetical protein